MKKVLSFVLTFIVLISAVVPMSISAEENKTTTVKVDNGNDIQENSTIIEAYAGKVAKVYLKISEAKQPAGTQITINYDTKLELAYVENGKDGTSPYFNNMYQSAIYGVDVGAENGTYVFNATNNMSNGANVSKISGYLVTLSFKVPDDAKIGDEYEINILKDSSKLVQVDNGINKDLDFTVVGGKIVVKEDTTACQTHNYNETVVGEATYVTPGFSYKECSNCHNIQIEKTSAWAINAINYEGIAIRYAGNPTGLAATFAFDENEIKNIELDSKYQVEVGTISVCGGKETKTIYYGDGKTANVKNGKIFAILTGIGSKDKAKFSAYVTIKDIENGTERTEYFKATLGNSEEVCIYDIAVRINLKNYPSDASQKYLNNVLNEF